VCVAEKHCASDKAVAEADEENQSIVKHVERLQVSECE